MPSPAPLVALLTDFGDSDWYVASLKAYIATSAPQARCIDISHRIEPGNVRAAAFVLAQCYNDFPPGTVFLCIVDPGVGSRRLPILLYTGDYYFLAPDNGLLSLLEPCLQRVFEIDPTMVAHSRQPSRAFHGRDIFAAAAAALTLGQTPQAIGRPIPIMTGLDIEFYAAASLPAQGNFIHFDHFGNAISNLRYEGLHPAPRELLLPSGDSAPFRNHYAEVAPGDAVAYLGCGGLIELAINQGNAREAFGLRYDDQFRLT